MRYLLLIWLCSCSYIGKKHLPVETNSKITQLLLKVHTYASLYPTAADSYGWGADKCDGLLFASLGATANLPINIMQDEKEPGKWDRHPSFDCYPASAPSTISKDMLTGLMFYLLKSGNKDALRRLETYGSAHHWIMGEGEFSRVYMTPSMVLRLRAMIGKTTVSDFEDHLDALAILTNGAINGGISTTELSRIEMLLREQPRNALYGAIYHKYSDGDQTVPTDILLDESLFPADRLPTTDDRCANYLWQKSDDEWKPCGGASQHDGIDLLFAASIIQGVN